MQGHVVDIEDTSWMAVKGGTVSAITRILSLSDPVPIEWRLGMEAVTGDFGDFFNCRSQSPEMDTILVTPLIRGWRLVVGDYLGAGPNVRSEDDTRNGWRMVAGWCRRLSKEFGHAHAFTDQAQLDWFAWILACDGEVFRQVVFEDELFLTERGQPTRVEEKLRAKFKPDEVWQHWRPDVGTVPDIASHSSVNPCRLGGTKMAEGYLAITPWGRKHGVRQNT